MFDKNLYSDEDQDTSSNEFEFSLGQVADSVSKKDSSDTNNKSYPSDDQDGFKDGDIEQSERESNCKGVYTGCDREEEKGRNVEAALIITTVVEFS